MKEAPSTSSSLLPYPGPPTQLATLMPSTDMPSPPTAGEHGPQLVHKPSSLVELTQVKVDLGSYSNNQISTQMHSNPLPQPTS